MVKNYIKIALRNLIKNKVFSLINIFGMTVGMVSFILIGIYIWGEVQYVQYYKEKENTFRIYAKSINENNQESFVATTPPTLAPALLKEFPEVESALRIMDVKQDLLVTVDGEGDYYGGAFYAESSIFDMLEVDLISGTNDESLDKPNTVIISESLANKLFIEKEALDKIVKINERPFQVSGVYKDFSNKSHLSPNLILSFSSFTQYMPAERMNDWTWNLFYTYIKFKEGFDKSAFEDKLSHLIDSNIALPEDSNLKFIPYLQNLSSIYLGSQNLEQDIAKKGSVTTLYALSASAIFIILIVCINFINLSSAQAMSRMKEVGIKKAVGATQSQVLTQLTLESILIALCSAFLAIILTGISLDSINQILETQLEFGLLEGPLNIFNIILFALVLGLMSGLYPAFYASRFKPLLLLSNRVKAPKSSPTFRSILVVLQFSLSAILVMVSIVVLQQMEFIKNDDLGFNKEHIVTIPLKPGLRKNLETTKELFLNHPDIISATYAYGLPGDVVPNDEIIQPGKINELPTNLFFVDHDYVQTLGLELIAGRDFDRNISSDESEAFIINERAVEMLGLVSAEDAIGKPLNWKMWHYDSLKKGQIVGVVKDFHFTSMREKISPAVLHYYPRSFYKMALKVRGDNLDKTLSFIAETWGQLEPVWPITYSFVDENFYQMYKEERKMGQLISLFTTVGIFIACLGLFGLVKFNTQLRLKEIGIRKVLGANTLQVWGMIIKKYIALVLIATTLAVPLSIYTLERWFSNFAYHIAIDPRVIIFSIMGLLFIALFTVSFQSVKAALTNPVNVLKEE